MISLKNVKEVGFIYPMNLYTPTKPIFLEKLEEKELKILYALFFLSKKKINTMISKWIRTSLPITISIYLSLSQTGNKIENLNFSGSMHIHRIDTSHFFYIYTLILIMPCSPSISSKSS